MAEKSPLVNKAEPQPLQQDEAARVQALRNLHIMDSLPEQAYQDVVELASFICGTPVSLISLIDSDRQWFKARLGVAVDETPRAQSFCAHTLQDGQLMVVEDATKDARFKQNPLVLDQPNVRFYAGAPFRGPGGQFLGAVCVIDTVPRSLTDAQRRALTALARQVESLLAQRAAEGARNEEAERHQVLVRMLAEQRASLNADRMIYAACEQLGNYLGAARVGYFEVHDDQVMDFTIGWASGALPPLEGRIPASDFLGPIHIGLAHTGDTLVFEDTSTDERTRGTGLVRSGALAAVGVPITRLGDWIAGFYVMDDHVRTWTEAEVAFVRQAAELTWSALEETRAQKSLTTSEEHLRLAQQAGLICSWEWDLATGGFTWVGDTTLTYGRPPEELASAERIFTYLLPEDAEQTRIALGPALSGHGKYQHEFRVFWPDGTIHWIAGRAQPIFDTDGTVVRLIGVNTDVSARRQAEADRAKSASRMQLILDSATDGMALLDRAWNFVYLNGSGQQILQAGPEVIGRNAWEVFPAMIYDGSPYVYHYYRAMDQGLAGDFVTEYPEPLNISIQIFVRPVPEGILIVFRDITEQKRTAAALVQTEKLAAVGRLASTIAHEINNPLEAVTNLLYLARTSGDLGEALPYLETADAELRRASVITNHALRFHKQASRPTSISFLELISGLMVGRHSRLENAGAQVTERDRTTRSVLCFEGEIRQVLNNLAGNAVDALQGVGGSLFLRARDGHDWRTGRAGMVMTVADTGTGMSQVTRKRLFDAFYSTKGIGGTGLGLWVSQEMMDRHAGRILVRSSQNARHRGTVFTVFLPYDASLREYDPDGTTTIEEFATGD